jgi:aminopeptidase YwaD
MKTQFDGQRAYQHVEYLSRTIGVRVSGTEGENLAAEYVRKEFESYGLKPQVLQFDAPNEKATEFNLEILEPEMGKISALPLVGTPDTPPEGLAAGLAFVEALQEPYVGSHVKGKIVILVNGGLLGRNLRKLLRYEPAGILLVGRNIGQEPNTFHAILKEDNKPFELVPTLHITYEDAVRLWNASANRARIHLKTDRSQGASHSVIAEVIGSDYPDEIIVVAGHMDTVPRDPGATDNAVGTGTVVELARLYAGKGSRRTLRFAAWGSEEGSGGGSFKYVLELKKKDKEQRAAEDFIEGYSKTDLEKHLLNINLDVLGMSLGNNACFVTGPQPLGDYIKALACELGVHHTLKNEVYGSDNISFSWAGIPAVSFVREGVASQYMHTARDNMDLIDAGQLGTIGNLIDVFIARTAAEGFVWPFERQVPEVPGEYRQMLKDHIRQIVEFLGEDPELTTA